MCFFKLENPIYIGTLIQGKTTSLSYRDRRRFKKDPSELTAFENAHEAIVSETTFLIVQDLLKKDTRCGKNPNKVYDFSGCLLIQPLNFQIENHSHNFGGFRVNLKLFVFYDITVNCTISDELTTLAIMFQNVSHFL